MEKRWYETLFENYARTYDQECFTQGTSGEVDFMEKELGFDRGKTILDIGCGTGRHAVELARRGYRVTGVDLSASQLARAREKAAEAGVSVDFRQGDACALDFPPVFDLGIMICEGAFPLQETDERNFAILQGAGRALRPGGKLVMTTLSVLYPLFHRVADIVNRDGNSGRFDEITLDLLTFREKSVLEIPDDDGKVRRLTCDERYYAPSELAWLLRQAGFAEVRIAGATLGAFDRDERLTPDHFEILAIAQKAPAETGA